MSRDVPRLGLGESVVDGSIVADRFVWDKVGHR